MPFVVDRLLPRDLDAALRLSTQAGWNQVAAEWTRVLDLSPDGCLAGRLDGVLVATATVASPGPGVFWIGMVLVDETLRGRGFGATMFTRVLALARERGGDAIGLDASDLGRPVYLKQGFVDVAPIDRWSGVLRTDGPADGVVAADRSSFDEIAALDRAACGTDRSALLLHLMHEPGVFGVVAPGSGYAFLQPGRLHSHVGPLIADSEETAARLLNRLARLAGSAELFVDAIRSPASSALLESRGLAIQRRLTRMTFARPQPLLMGPSVRAAVSFAWG